MHKVLSRILVVIFSGILVMTSAVPALSGDDEAMSIALPAELIKRSLQDILPLDIDEENQYLDGRLTLQSIDELTMDENSAIVRGLLIGKNLSLVTRVGDQDLRIKVGDLRMPLTCDLQFRFDASNRVLYVTPRLRQPASGSVTDMANSVTSLLTLFNNREYPVSLTSLKTLNARIGSQDISVDMEPVDIRVAKGMLHVKMVPRFSKTD